MNFRKSVLSTSYQRSISDLPLGVASVLFWAALLFMQLQILLGISPNNNKKYQYSIVGFVT